MEITEVRVKLMPRRTDKLRAFCCVTFDNSFVVRDLKIIEGPRGAFVAMPSRKIMERCPGCGTKNHLRAKYCNECGGRISPRPPRPEGGELRSRLHADISHPINAEARVIVERRIMTAYADEIARSKEPGYKPVELYDTPDEYDTEELTA